MNLGRYSKLIGAIVGNVVAIAVAYAAVQFPAIAECAPAPAAIDVDPVCTVMGFTQVQITAGLMTLVNGIFVYAFPANKPPA